MSEKEKFISCQNLWKIYGPQPEAFLRQNGGQPTDEQLTDTGHLAAVNDVSLDVYKGETLIVMGLSGSGKSTLLRCLSRLVEPTAGDITIEGRALRSMSKKELIALRRTKMGMVFQHFALLPHKTVLENVMFPLEVQGVKRSERVSAARELLKTVSLEGRDNHYPRQLSGGQQQRVGIARSLAVKPDIWFLDEPFSALDPLIRTEMQDEFIRLRETLGKTIMFITHDFDEALRLADRIAIMNHGRVEQLDTPDQIVLHPATEYIAKFTNNIAKSQFLTVEALTEPFAPSDSTESFATDEEPLRKGERLASVANRILNATKDALPVVDEAGQPFGMLHCKGALQTLLE
ncbi:MAG: betaine/proline/choline family ABC transporter ATP-binding protein [Chloroflexota bacterium]